MPKIIFKALAWISLLAIVIATLGPMALRPETSAGPAFERLGAFAICGLLFAIAYPRRPWTVALIVVVAAIALESLQLVIPGRHGHLADLLIKIGGGLAGASVAVAYTAMWHPKRQEHPSSPAKAALPVDKASASSFYAARPPAEE